MGTPLAELLRYNHWANTALFEACRALDDDQLDLRADGVSGSVRDLLTHIAVGQQPIVVRLTGGQQSSWAAWPGFDAILDQLARSNDELMATAERQDADEGVDLQRGDTLHNFPKSFLLIQALAHGVEHRTEIKVSLGAHGIQTPDLDSWSYAAAAGFTRRDSRISDP